ncbi:hypothetical protein [Rhodoferax sp.]|uniref:COG4705 family protein n=1 Tax=Rhodoferax sp. TaxID=50421 RepID=UPI00260ECC70|nr:hypothetical protein [Rhodoferax sp.]MDD2811226.1 hypothetical protein [Rhodoferax sp.]
MNTLSRNNASYMLNKVPEVTLFFWIIKIMATTVGETAADFLNVNLHLGLTGTSVAVGLALLGFLVVQLRTQKYVPSVYWIVVVLLSVFGTLVTDNLVDNLGVSLEMCTAVFSAGLAATFVGWYASEKTLSIHSIHTTRRELFYWAAIFFTFALGTAAGDLAAEGLKLGYGISVLVFAGMIAAITFGHYVLKFNAIAAFWMAYILTRPLGASSGDLLAKPLVEGGLGLGNVITSGLFLATILALVSYMTVFQNKSQIKLK